MNSLTKPINRFHVATLLMPSLVHTVKTKGVSNTVRRMAALVNRYGLTGDRLKKNLIEYIDLIRKYDGKITYPIPAITLQRNIGFIEGIDRDFIEWAMHGYVHINYAEENVESFKKHLEMGKSIFRKNGINLYGFRAPYLSISDKFFGGMADEGLSYDSSFSYDTRILADLIGKNKSAKRILRFYSPGEFNIRRYGELIEIPVWLPDDEMLIDRLKLSGDEIEKYLMKAGALSIRLKTPLVLQLHPERFSFFRNPLENFLKSVKDKGIEMLTLNDLSKKIKKENFLNHGPAVVITGDIDIISLSDLLAMKNKIESGGKPGV